MKSKAKAERKLQEIEVVREVNQIARGLDLKELTDGELTELRVVLRGNGNERTRGWRALEILRGVKARIDKGARKV